MKKIIFLDKELYIFDKRVVKEEFKYKRGLVSATLPYEKVYPLSFKLSKTIEKEMLEIEAERYVFTDGALDYTREYKIVYLFNEYTDFYLVDAFVIDVEEEKKYFSEYLKTFKYIDYISLAPFVFESFYKFNNPKIDVFIYLNENDAFLSGFKDGKLIFVKTLNKLSILSKNLNIDISKLATMLKNFGLDKESYEDEFIFSYIENFFSDFFMKVNNILNHAIGFYNLEKIDRIFFYSPFEIKGLFDIYKDYFAVTETEFKKYEINSEFDPFIYSAILYNVEHIKDEKTNISIFKRPLPIYKKRVGQIAIFIMIILTLLGSDLFLRYKKIENKKLIVEEFKKKYKTIELENKNINLQIKEKKKSIALIEKEIKDIQKRLNHTTRNLNILKSILKSPIFSNELNKILFAIYKNNLKLVSLSKNDGKFIIHVASKDKDSYKIALFMQNLIKIGFKDVNSVFVKENNGLYISEVKCYE